MTVVLAFLYMILCLGSVTILWLVWQLIAAVRDAIKGLPITVNREQP